MHGQVFTWGLPDWQSPDFELAGLTSGSAGMVQFDTEIARWFVARGALGHSR
jgi:hypothetical protein